MQMMRLKTHIDKQILDACCGSRMFWFDKEHPATVFMDNRSFAQNLCDGRRFEVKPDLIADFREIPFPDESFRLVVFDPPQSSGKDNLDGVYEVSRGIITTIAFLWLKALNDIKKDEYVTLIYVKNVMKEERHV